MRQNLYLRIFKEEIDFHYMSSENPWKFSWTTIQVHFYYNNMHSITSVLSFLIIWSYPSWHAIIFWTRYYPVKPDILDDIPSCYDSFLYESLLCYYAKTKLITIILLVPLPWLSYLPSRRHPDTQNMKTQQGPESELSYSIYTFIRWDLSPEIATACCRLNWLEMK